jgi:hypothetical protein
MVVITTHDGELPGIPDFWPGRCGQRATRSAADDRARHRRRFCPRPVRFPGLSRRSRSGHPGHRDYIRAMSAEWTSLLQGAETSVRGCRARSQTGMLWRLSGLCAIENTVGSQSGCRATAKTLTAAALPLNATSPSDCVGTLLPSARWVASSIRIHRPSTLVCASSRAAGPRMCLSRDSGNRRCGGAKAVGRPVDDFVDAGRVVSPWLFRARDHRGFDGDRQAAGDRRRTRRAGAQGGWLRKTFLPREEWAMILQ